MSEPPELEDSSLSCLAQGTEGDLAQCVIEATFAAGPSSSLIGLVLAGVLVTSLYIAGSGDVVVPAVVTILLGGAMVPLLPAQYVGMAYTVTVVGVTVAAFAVYRRFVTAGGF